MKLIVIAYTLLAGLLASSIVDFILCAVPLIVFMYRPRDVDVFVFTPEDAELAEAFVDHILESDGEYDTARVMIVQAQRLRDLIDDEE